MYPSVPQQGRSQAGALPPQDASVIVNLPDQRHDPAVYATGKNKGPGGAPGSAYPAGPAGYGQPAGQPYYPGYQPGPGPMQYPPAVGTPQQYPQAGTPPNYGPGMHVMGYPVLLEDPTYTPEERARERSGVFFATLCLFIGICFPLAWVVGSFLPCCYPRSRRVQRLALANCVAFVVATLLLVLLPVFLVRNRGSNNNDYYYG